MSKKQNLGIQFAPAWHRPFLRYIDGEQGAGGGSGSGEGEHEQGKTFTQDEVNSIVKERLNQQRKNEFGDYADLKARAEGARSIEQKLADLEARNAAAEARALRSEIAARHGISTAKGANGEPSDADLFLTGSDEQTLEAQAKRLAERETAQKSNGNRAPREGRTIVTGNEEDASLREFATRLFASAQNE